MYIYFAAAWVMLVSRSEAAEGRRIVACTTKSFLPSLCNNKGACEATCASQLSNGHGFCEFQGINIPVICECMHDC